MLSLHASADPVVSLVYCERTMYAMKTHVCTMNSFQTRAKSQPTLKLIYYAEKRAQKVGSNVQCIL